MKKKSTQRLMPDKDALNHICLHASYLVYCQKNFHLSRHPCPIGNGWGIIDGKCSFLCLKLAKKAQTAKILILLLLTT